MGIENNAMEKVAARLTLDISPAQKALLQLTDAYDKFNTQISGQSAGNSFKQLRQDISEVQKQLATPTGQTFIENTKGQLVSLRDAIKQTQLQFKEGQLGVESYIQSLEGLRKTYAQDFAGPTSIKNDTLLRQAVLQAQKEISSLHDFELESERKFEQQQAKLQAENLAQEQKAQADSINNQLRQIKEFYNMKLESAQTSLDKIRTLLSEESAYFEENEAKKIEAMKLENQIQAEALSLEEKAQSESINNQIRQIREFYNMKMESAQSSLEKIRALMSEETAYFEENEAKKIEAMKLEYKLRADLEAQQLRSSALQANRPVLGGQGLVTSQLSKMDTGFSTGKMIAGMVGFSAVMGMYESMVTGMKEVEEGAAGLHQVFEDQIKSEQQLNDVSNQFLGIAQKYGTSISDVYESAKLVGRQYKDIDTAMTITNQSTLLAVVDNVKLSDSVRGLEATMNAMGLSARTQSEAFANSSRIVDSWSALAHKAAVSATDLVQATERSAGAAHAAGVSFDQLQALITSGVKNTGLEGANVGNMLKSLFASIHTDQAEQALKGLNISLTQIGQNGQKEFRPVFDVLLELSAKLQTADKSQQKLLETISGGKFQYSKVASMLSDYKTIIDAYATSINSAGAAQEYAQVQMNTFGRDLQRLKDTFVQLTAQTSQNGLGAFLKGIVEGITQLIEGLQQLPPWVGQATLSFGGLMVGLQLFIGVTNNIATTIQGLGLFFQRLSASVAANTVVQEAQTVATTASTVALEAETVATEAQTAAFTTLDIVSGGLAIVIGAVITGTTMYTMSQGKATEATQQHTQALQDHIGVAQQEYNLAQQKQQFMKTAIEQEQQLKKALEDTSLSAKDRNKITGDMIDLYHAVGKATGDEALQQVNASNVKNQSLNSEQKAIDKLVKAKKTAFEEAIQANTKEVESDLVRTNKLINHMNTIIAGLQQETQAKLNELSIWQQVEVGINQVGNFMSNFDPFSFFNSDLSSKIDKMRTDQTNAILKSAHDDALANAQAQLGQYKAQQAQDNAKLASLKLDAFNVDTSGVTNAPGDIVAPKQVDDGWGSGTGSSKKKKSGTKKTPNPNNLNVSGRYSDAINAAANRYGIDPGLIKAIATQESDLGRTSSNVMQVNGMDGASPTASINAGTKEFAGDLKAAGGNLDWALAAYNMGTGVISWAKGRGITDPKEAMSQFSAYQKQKHGYKVYGDPNYIDHVKRYYSGKGGGGGDGGRSDSEIASDFSQPYKDNVERMNNSLSPYVKLNEQLDGVLSQLNTRQQTYSDMIKHGATGTRLAADETKNYQQKIETLKLHQDSLHTTNDQIRADMANVKQQMQALNPNNADVTKLPEGQQQALQALSDEYDKLSQQLDQNSQKWAEDQKDITQATLDWLDTLYQLQDNGLKPLSDQMHQNDNDLKAVEARMSQYSDAIKRNSNDTQALKSYTSQYHQEIAILTKQNDLLHQTNDQIRADNDDLRNKINDVNQLYKQGKITTDAHEAALQSLNNQIQKNSDALANNSNQWYQNIGAMQKATDDVRSMIVDDLQKAYQEEQQIQEQTLQDAYDKKKALLEKEKQDAQDASDAQIKALQDQQSAIDDTINALERQWQAQDNVNKLSDLQNQLDQVMSQKDHEIVDINGNLTYTYDVQKAQDLQKQISDEQTQEARDAQKQQLQDQKDALDKQIQNLRDHEQQVQQQYDNELKTVEDTYNQQKQQIDDYWKFRLDQDQLNQEADNLILKNGTDAALTIAQSFANEMVAKYNSITKAANDAAAAMANAMGAQSAGGYSSGGGGSSSGSSSGSGSSGGKINTSGLSGYAATYANAINSGKSPSQAAAAAAAANGTGTDGKGGINGGSFTTSSGSKSSSSVPKMATGATVTSPTLALIGEGGEPEHVIPDSKLQALLSPGNFTRLPGIKMPTITDFSKIQAPMNRTVVQTVQVAKLEFPNVRAASDAQGFTTQLARIGEKWYHAEAL